MGKPLLNILFVKIQLLATSLPLLNILCVKIQLLATSFRKCFLSLQNCPTGAERGGLGDMKKNCMLTNSLHDLEPNSSCKSQIYDQDCIITATIMCTLSC
jgi:hypothetical protein